MSDTQHWTAAQAFQGRMKLTLVLEHVAVNHAMMVWFTLALTRTAVARKSTMELLIKVSHVKYPFGFTGRVCVRFKFAFASLHMGSNARLMTMILFFPCAL